MADAQFAKAPRRPHRRDGQIFAVLAMKSQRSGDVDIAHAVAVGEEKLRVIADERLDAADASGGQGFLAGIGQRDRPILLVVVIVEFDIRLAARGAR